MATIAEALALGRQYHQQGALPQAERIYRQVLQAEPRHADCWNLLAALYLSAGRGADAVACYQQALNLRPEHQDSWFSLGNAYMHLNRPAEAVPCYQQAARLRPDHPESHSNLGAALADSGRLEEAIPCYREALRLRPSYAEAAYNFGNALKDLHRLDEAVASYREALRHRPDLAMIHNNLGLALAAQHKLDEAAASYREALRLQPQFALAHNNLGLALAGMARVEEALHHYEQSLRFQPAFAEARLNRALMLLVTGRLAEGWREYEWRWKCKEFAPRPMPQPMWDGTSLRGRTILLHTEQGVGDTLHFVRFAPILKKQGGTIILECPAALIPLLSRCPGVDQLVGRGSPLPAHDLQCPLLSLPLVLGTTLETVPAEVPYLSADPELIVRWRERLAGHRGFRIGITWQGSPTYRWDWQRSFPLLNYAPLAQVPGVTLLSLQKGFGVEQLREARERFPVVDLGHELDEQGGAFMDTAAVIMNLDLVITADTALGHLAGALGRPAWLPLYLAPDWRWMLNRDDSPWYPTIRLFRQTSLGRWDDVFDRMAAELRSWQRSGKRLRRA